MNSFRACCVIVFYAFFLFFAENVFFKKLVRGRERLQGSLNVERGVGLEFEAERGGEPKASPQPLRACETHP